MKHYVLRQREVMLHRKQAATPPDRAGGGRAGHALGARVELRRAGVSSWPSCGVLMTVLMLILMEYMLQLPPSPPPDTHTHNTLLGESGTLCCAGAGR